MSKNKNLTIKRNSDTHCEERENATFIQVIRLLQTWRVEILPEIEHIFKRFGDSLILYEGGEVKIFTELSNTLADKLKVFAKQSLIRLKLENIATWSPSNESFFIYKLKDDDTLVLPKVSQTLYLFEQLKENISPIYVKLEDILQEDYTAIVNSVPSVTSGRHNFSESSDCTPFKDRSCIATCNISLNRIRKAIVPTLDSSTVVPLSGEFRMYENFPQQVSEEQNDEERSVYAFSSGLSLPVTSDQASSLAIGGSNLSRYHGNNTLSGNETAHARLLMQASNNQSNTVPRPRHPDYINDSDRLRSYARWIRKSPDPRTLSDAGFFFTNDGDLVRCFQCGIGLKDFSDGDDPLREHVKHSGQCPFLIQKMGEARLTEWKRLLQAQDPEYNRQMQWNRERHNISAVAHNYRHPEYQTFESRVATFTNWPTQMMQRPEQLADAGLYYTGFEDQVRCFACDGGLRRWDPEDDPWTEHCRWFPACPFAKEKKGDEYIALIQVATALDNEENESAQSRGQDLSGAMEQMTLRDPEYRAALNEHRDACLEMGYQLTDFNEAVHELRNRGTIKPTIEEIIDAIEVIKARKLQESEIQARKNETPVEENQRLKSYLICMACGQNNVNALFLPCTHHRMCLECAQRVTHCPVCEKYIRQKIRTYLV